MNLKALFKACAATHGAAESGTMHTTFNKGRQEFHWCCIILKLLTTHKPCRCKNKYVVDLHSRIMLFSTNKRQVSEVLPWDPKGKLPVCEECIVSSAPVAKRWHKKQQQQRTKQDTPLSKCCKTVYDTAWACFNLFGYMLLVLLPHKYAVWAYLQMFLLIGIRVHKHPKASEIVHVSKYRTCERRWLKISHGMDRYFFFGPFFLSLPFCMRSFVYQMAKPSPFRFFFPCPWILKCTCISQSFRWHG